MAIEDLDLEFEDDEEKGKGDAVNVDIDLSFAASNENKNSTPNGGRVKPVTKTQPKQNTRVDLKIVEGVDENFDLGDSSAPTKGKNNKSSTASNRQKTSGALDDIKKLQLEVENLKLQIKHTQDNADLKLAVAQAEKNYLIEYVSNAKVLDVQITQILLRMNSKAPIIKQDAQAVKKLLNEFVQKSNPKK